MQNRSNPLLKLAPTFIFAAAIVALRLSGWATHLTLSTLAVIAAAAIYVVLAARAEVHRSKLPDSLAGVYSVDGNRAGRAILFAISMVLVILMLYTGVLTVLVIRENKADGLLKVLPQCIRALMGLLASVSFMIVVSQANYGDADAAPLASVRTASFILTLFACYDLMLIFRQNATNPYIGEFAWQLMTYAAFALMWVYLMGVSAGKQYRSIVWVRITVRMSIVLSLTAAVSATETVILFEMLFCFITAIVTDVMISANLSAAERRMFGFDDDE